MGTEDQSEEIKSLEEKFGIVQRNFDLAIKKGLELGEVKKLFHELKVISSRLDELRENQINGGGKDFPK